MRIDLLWIMRQTSSLNFNDLCMLSTTSALNSEAILGELNMCLVNPGLIIDLFQLQVAISRAVSNRVSGQMATKNIYSEILYCLSPSKNIVESFKLFGVAEHSSSLIVITFDICDRINNIVKGKT